MYHQKFTNRAETVVRLAQEAAAQLGHGHVGSEHILLALTREGNGIAARALTGFGVRADRVETLIVDNIGRGQAGKLTPQGLTPRTKRIIEVAMAEAMRRGHTYIGTEHLLMGIIRSRTVSPRRSLARWAWN